MSEGQKKLSVMMIVGMLVVGLVLAGGISYFIATKIVSEKGTESPASNQRESGVFMKLGDPKDGLILNIGGVSSGRYIKIGIILELKPDKKAVVKEGKMPSPEEIKILDSVVHTLRMQKPESFDPARQEQLKALLKSQVNQVLNEDKVLEVFITDFVLQ